MNNMDNAIVGFRDRADVGINGGAVALDSQGCKPLEGILATIRESRGDGIGRSWAFEIAMSIQSLQMPRLRRSRPLVIRYQGFAPLAIEYHRSAIQTQAIAPRVEAPKDQ